MKLQSVVSIVVMGLVLFTLAPQVGAEGLKPFVLGAEPQQTDLEQAAAAAKTALQGQGFEVAGSYAPYPNAVVIVVTSEALKANAAKSDFGGYGAGMRVAVTRVKDKAQVSYENPPYWAAAYRMKENLEDVKTKLAAALGRQKEFGSADGIKESSLRKYNYMMGMEKFDSLGKHELAEFKGFAEAISADEAGLAAGSREIKIPPAESGRVGT